MSDNPLLSDFGAPNMAPPFDSINEEHYLPAVKAAIKEARVNIDLIKNNPQAPDFENTIVALETASERLGVVGSIFYNQLMANGNDRMDSLAAEIGPLQANFSNDILLDEDLFARVKDVYEKQDQLGLTPEQHTLLEDTYKSFVRGGADLDEDSKKRLREISEKLSVLGPAFDNNVTRSAQDFELVIDDEADLAGLPEGAIAGAAHAAKERGREGKWLFTLDFPSFYPFLTYADNRALREQIWRAYTSRAYKDQYDNCDNILGIIRLRDERAKLLGYQHHADYVLERRMAKSPQQVFEFLDKLIGTYKPAAEKDLQDLRDFAAKNGGPENLKPWDIGYYSEKLKQARFHFSSEELRPYLQLGNVLTGVFDHFSKLFNLQFKPSDQYPVWHEDVTSYEVYDDKGGFIGLFYADFHPRKGKRQGAWKTSYRDQGLFMGDIHRPIVAIVCNFTKPAGDKPALLSFDEVSTLFHEMGHAVHALLSNVTYPSHAGTNVLRDFVELPSQVQENWAYNKDVLDMFARHYETGEKIPAELVDKLNKAKNFMIGWGGLRQVNFAMLDMAWHTADPANITDVAAFEDEATQETSLFPRLSGPFSTSFSHIFAGGYAAGYYGYKWAEVLDADTFELFQEKGLYDQETANTYKNEVLSKGGSEAPDVLYVRFRGREADPDALLRREGLL